MKKILLFYIDEDGMNKDMVLETPKEMDIKTFLLLFLEKNLSINPVEAYTVTELHEFYAKGWRDIEKVETITL